MVLTIEEEEKRSNWSSETEKKQLGLRSSKQKNKKQKQDSSNWSPKQNQFGVQNRICKNKQKQQQLDIGADLLLLLLLVPPNRRRSENNRSNCNEAESITLWFVRFSLCFLLLVELGLGLEDQGLSLKCGRRLLCTLLFLLSFFSLFFFFLYLSADVFLMTMMAGRKSFFF